MHVTSIEDQRAKALRYRLARAGVAIMFGCLMLMLIAAGGLNAALEHSALHPYVTGAFFAILSTIVVAAAAMGTLTLMANAADPDQGSS